MLSIKLQDLHIKVLHDVKEKASFSASSCDLKFPRYLSYKISFKTLEMLLCMTERNLLGWFLATDGVMDFVLTCYWLRQYIGWSIGIKQQMQKLWVAYHCIQITYYIDFSDFLLVSEWNAGICRWTGDSFPGDECQRCNQCGAGFLDHGRRD